MFTSLTKYLTVTAVTVTLTLVAAGCAPDITQDNPDLDPDGRSIHPVALFDLMGRQKLPFPSFLVQNLDPATGDILGDLNIPGEEAFFEQVNDQTGFTQLPVVTVDFSRAISPATIRPNENLLFMKEESTNPFVDFTFRFDGRQNKLYIYPQRPLEPATEYVVILTKEIASPDGAAIEEDLFFHFTKFTSPLYDEASGTVLSDLLVNSGVSSQSAAELEALRQAYQQRFYGKGSGQDGSAFLKVKDNLAAATGRSTSEVSNDETVEHVAIAWAFKTSAVKPREQLAEARDRVVNSVAGVYAELSTATAVDYYDMIESNYGYSLSHATLASRNGVVAEGSVSTRAFTGADGIWPDSLDDGAAAEVSTLIVYPGSLTRAPFPLVLFQHGLGGCKRDAVLRIAESFADSGIAVAGIDAIEHGARALTNVDETNDADPTGLCGKKIEGQTVTSGEAFFNVENIRASRDGLRQTVVDLVALRKALAATGDFSSIRFAGQGMGGVLGAMFLRVEPEVDTGVLNVPPAWLSRTLLTAPGFNDAVEGGGFQRALADALGEADVTSETFIDTLAKAIPLVQGLLDEAEPAYYLDGLPQSERVLIQMVKNDPVAINAGTELLASVGLLETYDAAVTDTGGLSALSIWPEGPHEILLTNDDPSIDGVDSLLTENSRAMRRQMIDYLDSDGTTLLPVPE